MTLIVEDGSKVADANSYVTVAEARSYATLRGLTLPVADAEVEALLVKAVDYIEAQRSRYQGDKTHTDQSLQFPRTGVYVDGLLVGSSSIPRELRYAQMALAVEAQNADLQPTRLPSDKGPVTQESVEGAVSVTYANPGRLNSVPAFAKADALLAPLMKRSGLTVVRG